MINQMDYTVLPATTQRGVYFPRQIRGEYISRDQSEWSIFPVTNQWGVYITCDQSEVSKVPVTNHKRVL